MRPYLEDPEVVIYNEDVLDALGDLPDGLADAVVTSPPYVDMRPEYGTPSEWLPIFEELRRVVRRGGMVWNVGRRWEKGIEQMWWLELINAATEAGWEHWDTLIWFKPNANPIQGNLATNAHEYLLCFGQPGSVFHEDSRLRPYAEGSEARLRRRWVSSISVKGDGPERSGAKRLERRGETREPNPGGARGTSVLIHTTGKEKGNKHPAPMPLDLALELVAFVSAERGAVLDPFAGSGTTALAARTLRRRSILIEIEEEYCEMIAHRLETTTIELLELKRDQQLSLLI